MFKNLFRRNKKSIIDLLPDVKGKYLEDAPLAKHTWFGVGGPAEVMFMPADDKDLKHFLENKPYNIPVTVIGGGSNLLIRDGGVPGVVIKLDSPFFKQVTINDDNSITCYAGRKNVDLKKILIENELGGLEFLCSIPGAVGGCVKTNAGCFGSEVKDFIFNATIIDALGEIKTVGVDDLKLGYRTSLFPDDWIIINITFKTIKDTKHNIIQKIEEQKEYRMRNQPHNERTAGSTFKNPEGLRAWELIKKSGADKLQVGGAKVSDKHCNFLINAGGATAGDIETLGEEIRKTVKEKTYIDLEWEVKRLGVNK
ncbi:MAG: UDP-N-acetylmuramate dehydrogenase [Lactobacillaceae bacterium]|jgi:UDP-N-acetylmuramate dehydrogenase|nr:UDP-N-acetylmuramate dehydrogenase [Lactobacillaceae bacterium]